MKTLKITAMLFKFVFSLFILVIYGSRKWHFHSRPLHMQMHSTPPKQRMVGLWFIYTRKMSFLAFE